MRRSSSESRGAILSARSTGRSAQSADRSSPPVSPATRTRSSATAINIAGHRGDHARIHRAGLVELRLQRLTQEERADEAEHRAEADDQAAFRSTRLKMLPDAAPSAMRMPISRRRCDT